MAYMRSVANLGTRQNSEDHGPSAPFTKVTGSGMNTFLLPVKIQTLGETSLWLHRLLSSCFTNALNVPNVIGVWGRRQGRIYRISQRMGKSRYRRRDDEGVVGVGRIAGRYLQCCWWGVKSQVSNANGKHPAEWASFRFNERCFYKRINERVYVEHRLRPHAGNESKFIVSAAAGRLRGNSS